MSQENLDLVRQLVAHVDIDLVPVVRDDDLWAAATQDGSLVFVRDDDLWAAATQDGSLVSYGCVRFPDRTRA